MKNITKFFALAVVILGFSANSFGQISANATATAKLITAISIAKNVDISFGNIIVGTAGTVVLTTAGTRSSAALLLPGGTVTAAQFTINGTATTTYTITLPTDVTVINDVVNSMHVTGFNHNASGTLAGASEVFKVGATLTVLGTEPVGVYTSADFPVTIACN